jgi:UDP-N-acetylglucosamine acyltransferase
MADDVEVQPFTIIEEQVSIGPGCVIGPHCVIGKGTVMGANNRTYSGAQIGVAPQDLKHLREAIGKTIIGDNNIFRESVTVSSSTIYSPEDVHKVTRIGSNCLFMACSHIAHDCVVGNRVILANSAGLAGHVEVQDGAILGGLAGVHQFCRVGAMAFIGGMSRINMDAMPYMIMEGHPAHCYGPNVVGLTRNGFSKEAIGRIRRVFKLLYRSGLNTSQAFAEIEKHVEDCEEIHILMEFVKSSKRGILR